MPAPDKIEVRGMFSIPPAKQLMYLNTHIQAWFEADPTITEITIRRK